MSALVASPSGGMLAMLGRPRPRVVLPSHNTPPLTSSPQQPQAIPSNVADYVSQFLGPGDGIGQIQRLPSSDGHRAHLVALLSGSRLMLKTPASNYTRLPRQDIKSLRTECDVLDLLSTDPRLPLPTRLHFGAEDWSHGNAPILLSHPTGTPYTLCKDKLDDTERASLDRELGLYCRLVNFPTAPRFGRFHQVAAGEGCLTWTQAFTAMIESLLRDGEDVHLSLPYEHIRHFVKARSYLLDSVSQPRLVLVTVADDDHILVNEQTKRIAGLINFDDVIWGDPLLANVFRDPSSHFLQGYGLVEGLTEQLKQRQLLYAVYRHLLDLLRHTYRPTHVEAGLRARRELYEALNRLAGRPG